MSNRNGAHSAARLEATVPSDVSMLKALEACGADMMYDCRRGEYVR